MSEALRMEVRPFGVRVVLIEPGDHKTGFTGSRLVFELTPETAGYRSSFETALAKAAQDEQGGAGPEQIARLVESIVNQPNPRLRYTTGPLPQRAAVWLKRLGPPSLNGMGYAELLRCVAAQKTSLLNVDVTRPCFGLDGRASAVHRPANVMFVGDAGGERKIGSSPIPIRFPHPG